MGSASRNSRSYQGGELATLAALWGFPTELLVVSSGPDVDAPTMTGLAISPSTLNVTEGPAYISITMNFTEDKTGLDYASLSFTSPSGRKRSCFLSTLFGVTSGNRNRGTVAGTCEFPRKSEGGNWSLDVVKIYDRTASRNTRSYLGSELATLAALWGFPRILTLVDGEPSIVTPAGMTCDFQQAKLYGKYCGEWEDVKGEDKFDWTRGTRTPSYSTGPQKGGTKGGSDNFLWIEVSSPRQAGDNAILRSQTTTFKSTSELHFQYNMFGTDPSVLKVNFVDSSGTKQELWQRTWTSPGQDAWIPTTVSLAQLSGRNGTVEIEGVRGSSWSGDIAIDDISFSNGETQDQHRRAAAVVPATTNTATGFAHGDIFV